ncbi:pentatricopeptide repeat-containing protein At5g57250, mitochondrial-like [Musa acuminata AAA Group]|uniref:pentatricopeptide repeat-containing protein At5g57250, mitochondrial-like n=1 Tax=Musa acuminata AAA Group TaxID=214697 RepID=UPI0031D99F27
MGGLRKHKLMVDKGITPDVIGYTIIIDGLCKEGNVEKVIGFLEEMESKGVHANVVTYTAVIHGFCRRNKLEGAFCALRKVVELGFVAVEFAYSVLIDGLCRKGDLDRFFTLFEESEKKEIKVGTVTYNTLINSLCKAGQASKANEISKGFTGDNFTYATLLHGYLKEMDVVGILEVKRRLDESSIVPDIVTCKVAMSLSRLCLWQMTNAMFLYLSKKNVDKAIHFLNVKCKRIISVSALTTVIDTFKKEPRIEDAYQCLLQSEENGVPVDAFVYSLWWMDFASQQGCLTEAFRIFDSLENLFYASYNSADWLKKPWISSQIWKRIVNPDDYTIAAILNGFCQRRDIEGALGFFTETKTRGYFSDFLGFMNLVDGLLAEGMMEEARSILRDILKRAEIVDLLNNAGDELHVESLDSLLSLACEQRRIKEVILVLNEISYLSISSTRSNSGRVFLKLKELHGSGVLDTENMIDGRGVHRLLVADVHGTNIKGGFIVKVDEDSDKEINEYLMEKPLGYDFATYYSIISLLCQRGDLQKANEAARTILQNPEKVFNQSIPTL